MSLPAAQLVTGLLLILFPAVIVGLSLLLVRRLRQRGGLEKALVNLILHDDRRRRFLIETSIVSATVVFGLVAGGITLILPGDWAVEDLALSLTFVCGATAVLALIVEGLINTRLTMADELTLQGSFASLAFTIESGVATPAPSHEAMYVPRGLAPAASSRSAEGFSRSTGRYPGEWLVSDSKSASGRVWP